MTKKATSKKVAVKKVPATRAELRNALLGHAPKPKTVLLPLHGQMVELHQPSLRAILAAGEEEDTERSSTNMIIRHAYVPDTNILIFEEADHEMILNWPFTPELLALQEAIGKLTGIDFTEAEAELKSNPLDKQS